jgi:flavin reductase (DIM6/NTAB) family NADH-FMN oxidoreductase RutF
MALSEDRLRILLRQMPSIVCVLTAFDDSNIYSATISSLVSLDIDAKEPVICFVLKKESAVGTIIREKKFFSISVLDVLQSEISSKFSQPREKKCINDLGDEYEWHKVGTFCIPECFALIKASLIKVLDDYGSDLYIANVEKAHLDVRKTPLIYQNRIYGAFTGLHE